MELCAAGASNGSPSFLNRGMTALKWAAHKGHVGVVRALLARGGVGRDEALEAFVVAQRQKHAVIVAELWPLARGDDSREQPPLRVIGSVARS